MAEGKGKYVAGSPGKQDTRIHGKGYGEKEGENIAPPEGFKRSTAGGGLAELARKERERRKKLQEERERKTKEEGDAIAGASRK